MCQFLPNGTQVGIKPPAASAFPGLGPFLFGRCGDFHPQSSSRSRSTASLAGFFDLSHTFDGPLRYGESSRFETMPSRPNQHSSLAWRLRAAGEGGHRNIKAQRAVGRSFGAVGHSIRRRNVSAHSRDRNVSAHSHDRKVSARSPDRKVSAGHRDVWASWRLFQRPHGMVRLVVEYFAASTPRFCPRRESARRTAAKHPACRPSVVLRFLDTPANTPHFEQRCCNRSKSQSS
jgi:hypothetical protein